VKWIVAYTSSFKRKEKYNFCHNRAAFHFLTDEKEISNYLENTQQNINPQGVLVIGTFFKDRTKKWSGIEIKQYSETTMTERMKKLQL
jgi:hypothetical protein